MSRDGDLRRQIAGLEALGDTVSAMSSLSAHHLHQAREVLPSTQAYHDELSLAVSRAGLTMPTSTGSQTLLVVLGSQLGLCGGYNGRVAWMAAQRRSEVGAGPTLAVGRRLASALTRQGIAPSETIGGVTSLSGVPQLVLGLARRALLAHLRDGVAVVEMVSARYLGVGSDAPEARQVLPLELPDPGEPRWSVRYTTPTEMVDGAARELLYVSLLEQVVDALASEHAARLLATRAAGDWLKDRSERLRRRQARLRQEQSTQETLEVASGARLRSS